jgi:hypothetical protein
MSEKLLFVLFLLGVVIVLFFLKTGKDSEIFKPLYDLLGPNCINVMLIILSSSYLQ